MEIIVSKIIIPVICTVLVSAITGLITYLKTRAKTNKAEKIDIKETLIATTDAVSSLKDDVLELKTSVDSEHDKLKDYIARNDAATFTLLHDRLFDACQEAIKDGYISIEDLENINSLFESYTSMGGNGTGKILHEKVTKLPIATEKE